MGNVNKKKIISIIHANVSKDQVISKVIVEDIINAFLKTVIESIKENRRVTLRGFGTLVRKQSLKREGVHPRTGERIIIPEITTCNFKISKNFKDSLNDD